MLDDLAERAAGGDEAAAGEVLEAVLPSVRNLVRYMVPGDVEADDIAQEALVTILRRLPDFRGEARFETWVYGVVARVTIGALRKRRRRESLAPRAPAGHLELVADHSAISESYLDRRRAARLLDQLPAGQREALVLHHMAGMSVSEVAEEVGAPVETVRSRLRLGRRKLRELEAEGGRDG